MSGLPNRYLEGGYFDADGNIREELILKHARDIATALQVRLTPTQLRRFYNHVKAAETRIRYGMTFAEVRPSILELSVFAAEAEMKGKVPRLFREFIDRNVALIKDQKAFNNGFVKHFQAVVGYSKDRP